MAMGSSITCISADCSRVFLFQPPTLAGNAVLLAFFSALIPIALALGARYKSPGFSTAIATGLALETVGYVGRLLLRNNHDSRNCFAAFLIGTTLGPTCICGAMFSIAPRIVAIYGEEYRSWRPVWYLLLVSVLTMVSFVFELVGSLVATVQGAPTIVETGVRLLAVGLAVQLIALTIFVFHATLLAITLRTRQHDLDPSFAPVYNSFLFRLSLAAFIVATTLVIMRTEFRTIQVARGLQSSITQTETLFFIFDGAAMLIAIVLLLACLPARALGEYWPDTLVYMLSQKPQRQTRQPPVQLPVTQPSPTYRGVGMRSSMSNYSPRMVNHRALPSQTSLVVGDNLW
ncbi:RTA1 like protein-domain-containing protein [Xylaria digitata]|nr:RTA1 like protein-domain-containing protein [Xylaria digitata]